MYKLPEREDNDFRHRIQLLLKINRDPAVTSCPLGDALAPPTGNPLSQKARVEMRCLTKKLGKPGFF